MKKYILSLALFGALAGMSTSCEDMLDKGNDYVIYADDRVLCNPSDTVTSLLGILNKLQAIAVRTNLLGEVRADLVVVNDNATTDLKDMASFGMTDDNAYNSPRDYYAVINNCNYYLAHTDSLAGNTNRNEKYFEAEIAQVHSIRAWTYLQLVLVYGKVPFVTEPVLTKAQSDSDYPMVDLSYICDYFINDLKSYYGKPYPDFGTVGSNSVNPQKCFFPTQLVTADLYLWKAVLEQNPEAAKSAAKAYYDYIVWDQSGKDNLYTGTNRFYWTETQLYNDSYSSPNSIHSQDQITYIPMDSAATEGYYNELRNLYCTTNNIDWQEASISPSEVIRSLSQAQTYMGYDTYKNIKSVTADKLEDKEIKKGYLGDLRYQYNYSQDTRTYNSKELDNQQIRKHSLNNSSSRNVTIYRTQQVYLRLAEALNYAGYPRFAREILTMGLSNQVIQNRVQRYYTSATDSAFISYFDFSTTDFRPYAEAYTEQKDSSGIVQNVDFVLRSSIINCNMWGLHSRGSGLAFLNEDYVPLVAPDSTSFPFADAVAKPKALTRPEVVDMPWILTMMTAEEFLGLSVSKFRTWFRENVDGYSSTTDHPNSEINDIRSQMVDSVSAYQNYPDLLAAYLQYQQDSTKYDAYIGKYDVWYKAAYSSPALIAQEQKIVDQAILDEQALELVYEGNRFFDLMRRAYWYNDNTVMSKAISQRDAAGSVLSDRNKWFINWRSKIGM